MPSETEYRAILVADCGMERTRVALVDIIAENEYRLVAQCEIATTVDPPISDVTVSIRQAIIELERSSGRQLLEDGRLRIPQGRDGQGLDAFVATCSAGGALPVLVMAVTADISAKSALLAVEGTYAVPFRVITMEEILRDDPLADEHEGGTIAPWWKAIEALSPGVLLMVGGIDGGNVAPLRTLARALLEALPPLPTRFEQEVTRPTLPVVYAGNSRAQEVVQQYLADRVDLRVVDNIRPNMREQQLFPARQELVQLYEDYVLQRLDGYEELASWCYGPVQLPYVGLQLVARFLAAHHQRQTLALDLGSGSTAVVWAEGERCERVVLGHFGMGYGIGRVLAQRGAARIKRWLPFPVSEDEVQEWVLNRALRPRTLPTTVRDCLMQQATAREALAEAMVRLRAQSIGDSEIIVASGGGLSRSPRLSQALLVLLDALEPCAENAVGMLDIYLDRSSIVPSVGALATLNPDAAACVLLKDGLFHLGPCLVPLGRGRKGARALTLVMEYANGIRQEIEVSWGEIACIPFRWGEAHLTVEPAAGTRMGLGRNRERLTTEGGDMLTGGAVGLIVDARGRPLELPEDEGSRWATLREWLEQCDAYTAEELESLIPSPPPGDVEEDSVDTSDEESVDEEEHQSDEGL